jgi:hypothetical protein
MAEVGLVTFARAVLHDGQLVRSDHGSKFLKRRFTSRSS